MIYFLTTQYTIPQWPLFLYVALPIVLVYLLSCGFYFYQHINIDVTFLEPLHVCPCLVIIVKDLIPLLYHINTPTLTIVSARYYGVVFTISDIS